MLSKLDLHIAFLFFISLFVGCGDDSTFPGEPIVGSLTAQFRGESFVPSYGVALDYVGLSPSVSVEVSSLIILSEEEVSCETNWKGVPPYGRYIFIYLSKRQADNFSDAQIAWEKISSSGTSLSFAYDQKVTISLYSSDKVEGTLDISSTTDTGENFIKGSFQVKRCAGEVKF